MVPVCVSACSHLRSEFVAESNSDSSGWIHQCQSPVPAVDASFSIDYFEYNQAPVPILVYASYLENRELFWGPPVIPIIPAAQLFSFDDTLKLDISVIFRNVTDTSAFRSGNVVLQVPEHEPIGPTSSRFVSRSSDIELHFRDIPTHDTHFTITFRELTYRGQSFSVPAIHFERSSQFHYTAIEHI